MGAHVGMIAMAVAVAGCGRLHFEAVNEPEGDASTDTPPIDTAPIAACTVDKCPTNFVFLQGGCYALNRAPLPWLEAQQVCEGFGGHLLVTNDVDEHFAIHTLAGSTAQVWIGWSDRRQEGNFQWIAANPTGPTVDSTCFFAVGEPTAGDNAHCVAANGPNSCGDHVDLDCATPLPSVCECDGRLADPATF